MVESRATMRCSRRNVGLVWLAGLAVLVTWSSLAAEQTVHVTLVDPAITRCTVCHKSVEAAHPELKPEQDCLACHRFEQRDGNTYLVDARSPDGVSGPVSPTPGETVVNQQITSSAGGVTGARAGEASAATSAPVVAPPPSSAGREVPESAATIATRAPDRPRSAASGAPDELIDDQSKARYASGLDAFRQGDVESAFQAWEMMLAEAADGYTLQIAVDRHLESARHALDTFPAHALYVVPRGGAYYVLSGVFPSRASAAEALGQLPNELTRDGAFPTAVRALPRTR